MDRRCFYLKVPAGREQETAYRRTLPRRGVHRLSGLRVSTRFPFGLLRRSMDVDAPAELLVYPALLPVRDAVLSSGLAELNDRQSTARTRRGEFESLREFRPGDDPRDIHWRTSARRGTALRAPVRRQHRTNGGGGSRRHADERPAAGARFLGAF